MTLKVVELFAGIGAQAQALENLGIDYESVVCEIDKYAYQSYCAIHGETENLGDICEVRQLPDCDLLTYSFPCQDLSQAGNMKGMSKDSGTRSSLLWEVGRLLTDAVERERAPAVLLMENVPQVHGKKNLADWNAWLEFLDSLGYTNSYADLNAVDYGVPQNRIRCFMVSTRDGSHYQFPKGRKLDRCLKDVLETDVDESFYLSEKSIEGYKRRKADHVSRGVNFGWEPTEGEGVARCLNTVPQKDCQNFVIESGNLNLWKFKQANQVFSDKGISPCIQARMGQCQNSLVKIEVAGDLDVKGWLDKSKRVYDPNGIAPACCAHASDAIAKIEVAGNDFIPEMEDGEVCAMHTPSRAKRQQGPRCKTDGTAFTVTCQDRDGVAMNDQGRLRIRYLTPLECWRLMGFSDEAYSRARDIGTSKTQLYKQAGNSIVVDVLMAIFKPLYVEKKKGQPTLEAWF